MFLEVETKYSLKLFFSACLCMKLHMVQRYYTVVPCVVLWFYLVSIFLANHLLRIHHKNG